MLGLYLHIPFCKQACSYCDFYFVTRQKDRPDFINALLKEIESYKDQPVSQQTVQTIYFGGGTPSLLRKDELEAIFHKIGEVFKLQDLKELTIEVNPDDVTRPYLEFLKSLGVNRLSMGVQSFNDEVLTFMHRAHNADHARSCLKDIKHVGFDSYSVDLIYGNPDQSLEMLQHDIDTLISFDPPHISAYSLTVEEGTRLGKAVSLGKIKAPEDDIVIEHFDLVYDQLQQAGYHQYEISNYAKPGKEAIHNTSYWKHVNYLGFGPSAHTFLWDDHERKAYRLNNKRNLSAYLDDPEHNSEEYTELDLMDLAEERIMLALRTKFGITKDELEKKYDYVLNDSQYKYIEKMIRDGYMHQGDTLVLTHKGRSIADPITIDLISRH